VQPGLGRDFFVPGRDLFLTPAGPSGGSFELHLIQFSKLVGKRIDRCISFWYTIVSKKKEE
jgi:hypothetical protein